MSEAVVAALGAAQSFRDVVAAEIRAEMARRQLPHNTLATALNTSTNSISRRLRGRTPFDVDELDQVARFLGIPLGELLAPALRVRDGRTPINLRCSPTAAQAVGAHGVGVTSPITRRRARAAVGSTRYARRAAAA